MVRPTIDLDVTAADVAKLSSADAVAEFFAALKYRIDGRKPLTAESIGLAGRTNVDHLLVLTSDFATIEFVLLDKRRREARGPAGGQRIQVVPLVFAVDRKSVGTKELRTIRRFTWTGRDGLEQFDKLRSVFEAAAFTEDYFCNRALFADHYLVTRLQEDAAWRESPAEPFRQMKERLRDAKQRWGDKEEQTVRDDLYEPVFQLLGFKPKRNKGADDDQTKPDYLLTDADGNTISAAFTYVWDRWLDGPDHEKDLRTPDENPGACVVTALEDGVADWIIVTNGRQWRLYSRHAHSRATNFYEVDLPEALIASGDTDPNEAFRYWWLFFRAAAYVPVGVQAVGVQASACPEEESRTPTEQAEACTPTAPTKCWLDRIAEGSSEYAKELGERLKDRIFKTIFPHLARGFLLDRKQRLGIKQAPGDDDLQDVFQGTLTLLYRLLFLLYAESRDLLPVREAPYHAASLKKIKQEIAGHAGVAQSDVDARLKDACSASETTLYDRLQRLFGVMDLGDPSLNVPTYNGGLFITQPDVRPGSDVRRGSASNVRRGSPDPAAGADRRSPLSAQDVHSAPGRPAVGPVARSETGHNKGAGHNGNDATQDRELRIARFLCEHKVPDRQLALAIDLLSRDEDPRTFALVFIDYKSLAVRHLGSIYEGLLEFKLKVADEDLTTQSEKGKEKYIPLGKAKASRGRKSPEIVVKKGEVYLSNDKAERKASGSYYTPDPIVEYIVEHTVGPVLAEKLDALRPQFRKVRKTYDNEVQKAKAYPVQKPGFSKKPGFSAEFWDPKEFALEKVYTAHKDLVEELFEFRTLDPAMGSGHFLVETVDFITDRLLTFLNQFPINPVQVMLDQTRRKILASLIDQGVQVNPDKLTDVNLLKRHVLKRCIYGVDLNPMAVELAKVSLWLDAFTLGAPLSFLNHHLRCGNSLIGATMADLKSALKGRLFGIDYAAMERAINHVLLVNRMADATAAEVKQSASEYDQARSDLSGYRIVLDLLVARHFGYEHAPEILTHVGKELDLSSRQRFEESLAVTDRLLVQKVADVARQPELRFFHWEIEFPEVFYGVAGGLSQQHVKHKDEIAAGSAGFDAVVGNPPYDEMSEHAAGRELPEKQYLKDEPLYKDAQGGRLNIFRPFVLRAMAALREGGRHSFIVPMALLADNFTAALRKRLLTEGWLRSVVAFPQKDDPHNRVFFEAKLSTCIYVAHKSEADTPVLITTYPGKSFHDAARNCSVTLSELERLDPEGLSLPAISEMDFERWKAIEQSARVSHFSDVARCYLGELMTNTTNAHLTSDQPVGPRLLRGANINYYVLLDEPKQGEALYLREAEYLREYAEDIRSTHHSTTRIGFQESCPIDNWRRLIACVIPPGHYCVHKIRYFAPDAKYDLYTLLAIFNSKMPDWRFSLTSTNNSVNQYEVDALPIPRFERLAAKNREMARVDWERWDRPLASGNAGVATWESDVANEIRAIRNSANAWPNAIHDALAAGGKEMKRLAETRQRLTTEFADWLTERLGIDDERFSGMTYLRGGQADFDEHDWEWLHALLTRNRRACSVEPEREMAAIRSRHTSIVAELAQMRERFRALDAAIDRVVWQLVGLAPDGSIRVG